MTNNIVEIWYWIVMLAVLAGIVIYQVFCLMRYLWATLKKRRADAHGDFHDS